MKQIRIEVVENGFIVKELQLDVLPARQWAFETADSLSEFVLNWGNSND